MSDAIAKALAAAEAEAEHTPDTGLPAAQPQGTGGAVAPAAPGKQRTLTDFLENAAMNVEAYVTVSELGLRFGKDKLIHDSIDVEMKFGDAKAGYVLRVNTAGGVQYLTSWDGVIEARSRQNWQAVIAQAKQMDGNSYPSDLIELPVRLLGEGKRKEGGNLPEGTVVGLSISYMNSKAFGAFLKEQYPRYGADTPFKVRITAVPKKGSGQDYGVFGYEIIDEAAGDAPAKGKKAA